MNYYTILAQNKYKRITWKKYNVLTNYELIKAIYCIETVHRNVLWRLLEYLYWIIFPRKYSHWRILTIGVFQIKTIYLNSKSKIKSIIESNRTETIDNLLYNHFPGNDWKKLKDGFVKQFVLFYNGDKTGNYYKTIKLLLNMK